MKKVLLPVFSLMLAITLIIGSAGITLIVKSCHSCGISVSSGFLTAVSPVENDCCSHFATHCSPVSSKSIEKKCCTYITENITLNNYLSPEKITFNETFENQPYFFISPDYSVPSVYVKLLSYHNKHGGRDMVISNCQYLI